VRRDMQCVAAPNSASWCPLFVWGPGPQCCPLSFRSVLPFLKILLVEVTCLRSRAVLIWMRSPGWVPPHRGGAAALFLEREGRIQARDEPGIPRHLGLERRRRRGSGTRTAGGV